MTLKLHPLDSLLELEDTRGSAIPYLGYVEANLQIAGIRGYSDDFLLLVIPTMTYSQKVPRHSEVQNHHQGNGNDHKKGTS